MSHYSKKNIKRVKAKTNRGFKMQLLLNEEEKVSPNKLATVQVNGSLKNYVDFLLES